jgi:Tfp pilus assembly protein PilF
MKCEAPDCDRTTREGKPFCSEHVAQNDYASKVLAEIAKRERQDEYVLRPNTKPKNYPTDGVTAQSILQQLSEKGTRTKERLCRELNIEKPLLDAYTEALVRKRLIRVGRTSRGSETLSLRTP